MSDNFQESGSAMANTEPIKTEALYSHCDPALVDFDTSDQAAEVAGLFGQRRVVDALEFGVAMSRPGYNLFVISDPEGGSQEAIRRLLDAKTASMAVPGDWGYVFNFDNPQQPQLIALLPGSGAALRRDMLRFTEELYPVIEAALDSDDFRTRVEAIQSELKERREKALRELGDESSRQGIALLRTEGGFVFSPLKGDEPMPPDEFAQLSDDEKERFARAMNDSGERMQKLSYQFPRWHRDMQASLKQLGRETVHRAVGHLIDELKERHAAQPKVLAFLDRVLADVVEYGEALRDKRGGGEGLEMGGEGPSVQRYQVNLLVDHCGEDVAPIIFESNPTFPNLVGRLDYVAHMGTWVTNFTLIQPGALQRANGGFLMLDAIKVLGQPYAWDCLKRALKLGQIQIESLGQALGFATNLALEPEPMPLQCKVVIFGEPRLYFLLKEYDPEFDELFKVAADFERDLERSAANTRSYARELASIARRSGMMPFERRAVARLIEHSSRLAGDAERLSMATRRLTDLMDEANHHAGRRGRATVAIDDVEAALKSQVRRLDRFRDRYQEAILRGTFLIDSAGTHVGQINGLAVIDLGDLMFAHPVRITATFRLGEGEVVDIERETELGGPIHSKGVMVISSFLAARFAAEMPLSLSASLVFEQSYGPVEGDSASLAELCALLSALAAAPIRQSLAVTGSVNQFGRVQAIGAVNEKIEGFFDICRLRGLTGDQGVIIPDANVKHLMLRRDVVDAAEAGRFRIYAVATVEQAIELLTGVPGGAPDEHGVVPPGSINHRVAAQLTRLFERRREFSHGSGKERVRHGAKGHR